SGRVDADGFVRTTSPPYPGFSQGGQYRLARADVPNRLVSFGPDAPGSSEGYNIGVAPLDYSFGVGGGLIPIFYTLTLSMTFSVYSRSPNEVPFATQVFDHIQLPPPDSVAEVIKVTLPQPDPSLARPKIDNVTVTALADNAGEGAQVRIDGLRFKGAK